VANSLNSFRKGAVGFIDWLDRLRTTSQRVNSTDPSNEQRNTEDVEDDVKNLCPYKCIIENLVAIAAERLKNKGRIIIEHRLDTAENNGKNSGGGNDVEKPQARSEQRDGPQN
jgi:hypothetical protein